MSFPYPEKPWYDGQKVSYNLTDTIVMTGTYLESKNLWAFARVDTEGGVDVNGNIYTPNVLSLNTRPVADADAPTPFIDEGTISNQQDINWALYDLVGDGIRIWIDEDAPEDEDYQFWWDTSTLELLFYYNEQWFPVSIPPAQVEFLRQEIDALYQDTATNRLNIAITQQELDTKVLETKERIDGVEETANDAKAVADAATVALANAAQLDQNNSFSSSNTNTFNGPVESKKVISVKSPSSNSQDPNFEILGTSRTGTANSKVLYTFNSGSPTRLQARYRGPLVHDDEIVNKAYVDNLISIANAPARYGWEVRTNYPLHKPFADNCNMDTDRINNCDYIYLSLQGIGMDRPIQGVDEAGVIVYSYSTAGQAMVLSCWFKHLDGTWKWKGTAELREVKFYDTYMRIQTRSGQRWDNDVMTNGDIYYFTVSGLF